MNARRYLPDRTTGGLLVVLLLATFLPVTGKLYDAFNIATDIAVALLFFLHGLKLSREAALAGFTHWRLHIFILILTFVFFPLLGIVLKPLLVPLIGSQLYTGFLFLCICPSTVQSSIAFTSMAKGNVAAAVCAASASSILGIFLTPMLMGLIVMPYEGSLVSLDAVWKISVQLLLPFILGQILRPRLGAWIDRKKKIISWVDQGSILLIVYTAFSSAIAGGLWRQLPLLDLFFLIMICSLVLALVLSLSFYLAKKMGFNLADRITIMFCGSKKSLASGVPILKVLVPAGNMGSFVLPLMIFHQIQLMVCSYLAQRFRKRTKRE